VDDNEQALVDEVLSGDQAAAARLVNDYARMVGTVIWRATGDDGVVEDLAQETFLRVFRALAYFDSRGKLSTWIYTIAHRVAIDHLRRCSRRREEALPDQPEFHGGFAADLPTPEDELAQEEMGALVRREMARLPETYRLALQYTAMEELDGRTVAAMMGIPPGTLKTHVFRGKKMLKEKILYAMQTRSERTGS
jgi:RNA polymerase sigma-70 factor (ECF subfamily)